MAGTKGNKNAEKWTEAETLEALSQVWDVAQEDECNYLVTALSKCGLYADIWAYWQEKFSGNKVVFRAIKKVEAHIEQKLVEKALAGKVHPSVFIFVAKCKFGFQEPAQQIDQRIIHKSVDMTDEELERETKRLDEILDRVKKGA